jgi:hypothetical protein
MPLLFVPGLSLLGIMIALYRRDPRRFLDGPTEDAPLRLTRWAAGLLSQQRHEWGQAMLGELDHVDGRIQRMRFALGCVATALVLPPWGRAAAGAWTMITLAAASVSLYVSVAIHYRLAAGDWVAAGILTVFVTCVLLGASALVRRPGVPVPGLLGGLIIALASLSLSGFTFYDQIVPHTVHWHEWVGVVAVPFAVGAAGSVWARDPVTGRRIARLAAITASLGLFVYETIAAAVIGGGGPFDQDGGGTLRGTVSDRLSNNQVFLAFTMLVVATVGWSGAAAAGVLFRRALTPAVPGPASPGPETRQEA